MKNIVSCVFIFMLLLLNGCTTPTPDISYENPYGNWRTKIQISTGAWLPHGVMTFVDREKATYAFHNGRILFKEVNNQGLWKGYWIEATWGTVRCSIERDGSKTWGEAILQFDQTYNLYKGTWDACGKGQKYAWVGNRL